VWQNTTQPGEIWDVPMYYEFFAAVREVNQKTGSQVRVVLGDPPIDWASIQNAEQLRAYYPQRDPHGARVIQQEVLQKNRRALLIFGAGHIVGRDDLRANTVVAILARESNARIFTISNGYPEVARFEAGSTWPVPSLIRVKGTTLGVEPSEAGAPLEQDFDAVLHLGGPAALAMNRLPGSVCDDPDYLAMRFKRYALADPVNPDAGASLKRLCSRSLHLR
jgi:hypothetical protein